MSTQNNNNPSDQPPTSLYNSDDNQDILSSIQNLQNMEQDFLNNLESTPNLSQVQKDAILNKINQLSSMRVTLYKTLNDMNGFYENALNTTNETLTEQTAAVDIIENELNQTKSRLEALKDEKNNKIRLIEINRYYGERYEEHSNAMKIIIFMLIPIIILAILNNKGILTNQIYYILVGIIAVIGAYFLWNRMFSIWNRNNMEYQQYDWRFNPDSAPKPGDRLDDPWLSGISGTCIGQRCCSEGLNWDSSLAQCIAPPVESSCNTTGNTNAASPSVVESFVTESQANDVFTKHARQKNKKPDVVLGSESVEPYISGFINYKR